MFRSDSSLFKPIKAQAASVAIPPEKIYIPADSILNSHEEVMLSFYQQQKEAGIESFVLRDVFFEDLKRYRAQLLAKAGLEGIFQLWKKVTDSLSGTLW